MSGNLIPNTEHLAALSMFRAHKGRQCRDIGKREPMIDMLSKYVSFQGGGVQSHLHLQQHRTTAECVTTRG